MVGFVPGSPKKKPRVERTSSRDGAKVFGAGRFWDMLTESVIVLLGCGVCGWDRFGREGTRGMNSG